MQFRDLQVGDTFRFSSESDARFKYSGMATGPWRKSSARRYDSVEPEGLKGVRVGSVTAPVDKVEQPKVKA